MFVAVDGRAAGLLAVADPIKASTPEAIRRTARGRAAHRDADRRQPQRRPRQSRSELGIDEIEAEVLPERKGEVVKRLQAEGRVVAMAGDGDQRRARAGAGATSASPWARAPTWPWRAPGVTLVKGDLRGIVRARRLSRAHDAQHPAESVSSRLSTTRSACRIAAGVLYPVVRAAAQPHDRQRRDELQFGLGDRERAAAAAAEVVT